MLNTFMLLLVFTLIDPEGFERDEKIHILSQHFDTQIECKDFVETWHYFIHSKGVSTAQEMLKENWKMELKHIGCTKNPSIELKNDNSNNR